jgi:pimeloyl-ACP methyl ester carboxylesterase
MDAQLRRLSDLAAADPAVGRQVPDMVALLERVLTKLEAEPLVVPVRDSRTKRTVEVSVGKFGLQLIIRLDVGDRNDFPEFPALFVSIDRGDVSLLAKYVEKRYNQFGRGISGMSTMMDLFSGATSGRLARIRRETPAALLGEAVNFPDLDIPEIWGNPDLGDAYRAPLRTDVRTLFVSGTLDSNTPPEQAEEVRRGFPNSSHIVVEYAGHEQTLPHQDVQKAVIEFFEGRDPGDLRLSLGRPQFVPITGAGKD